MDGLMQDIRYAVRAIRRSPGFAAIAALTLALGIGANTAIFSVVNGVLLSPLPYKDSDRLVMLWETTKDIPQITVSYQNYLDWRVRHRSFEDIAIYNGFDSFNMTGNAEPERVQGGLGSGNIFTVLGVTASLGRLFGPTDDRPGAERVAVLTHGYWQRRFGGDRGVIGRPITLDGNSYTIVGVLPERFRLAGSEVWIPIGLFTDTPRFIRTNHPGTLGLGRLKREVTIEQMRADLSAVARSLEADYPRENAGIGAGGAPLKEIVVGDIRPALLVLAGAVGLVLLIACANVANLLLGRAAARQKEFAVRVAIGAGPGRLVRQLLTESVVLAAIGGVLGVALAWGGVKLLLALRPANVPRLMDIRIDGTVLAFAVAVSVLTGIIFGLAPALLSSRSDPLAALKEGGRGATAGRARLRLRAGLTVAEVALALVLLVGAGLLLRSFSQLTQVNPGVDPRNVVAALVQLPERTYAEDPKRLMFFEELTARVRALPQVAEVALTSDLPVTSSWQTGVTFEGQAVAPGSEPILNAAVVDPQYFRAMRIRLLAGRGLEPSDVDGRPRVMVISEAVAKRFFPTESPVGRRMRQGNAEMESPWLTIVGVVSDVKDGGLAADPRGTMYFPLAQMPASSLWLVVRSASTADALVPMLRRETAAIDPELPLASVQTLQEYIDQSVASPRFSMLMLGIFAAVALLLAAVGIYGVISYSVAQRTKEIGVRIALGAQRATVVGMVVRQVMTLAGLGIAIGVVAALASGKLIASLLFGVGASDPLTFVGVSVLLASVALLAAALPAIRAARTDPIGALRAE